jgi:hypothetical protein
MGIFFFSGVQGIFTEKCRMVDLYAMRVNNSFEHLRVRDRLMKTKIVNIITDLLCLIWGHVYESHYCEICERHIVTGERYNGRE